MKIEAKLLEAIEAILDSLQNDYSTKMSISDDFNSKAQIVLQHLGRTIRSKGLDGITVKDSWLIFRTLSYYNLKFLHNSKFGPLYDKLYVLLLLNSTSYQQASRERAIKLFGSDRIIDEQIERFKKLAGEENSDL